MKVHEITDYAEIRSKLRAELEKCFTTGYSYGARSFCQVIRDKIDNYNNEDKTLLLADILDFANKTLNVSANSIKETIEETKKITDEILGKDNNNAK